MLGLFAAFEDPDAIYLVQEVAPGGDLYRAMGEAGGYLGEEEVAHGIVQPLISALAYLHSQVLLLCSVRGSIAALVWRQDQIALGDLDRGNPFRQGVPEVDRARKSRRARLHSLGAGMHCTVSN